MGTLTKIRHYINSIEGLLYRIGQLHGEKRKIKDPRRVRLINKVILSPKQQKEIDTFYKSNYGRKIPYNWHRLYQSFTGEFHKDYFPEFLYTSNLEPMWNPLAYQTVYADKNLLSVLAKDIPKMRTARIFGSNVGGVYRNGESRIVSKNELLRELNKTIGNAEIVIKPTIETGSGKNVRFYKFIDGLQEGTGMPIELVLDQYNMDWNIQECVKNHSVLSNIYPYSVNTFRVITYVWEGKVYTTPLTLRVGRHGNRVDNAHADGLFVGCTDDGYLREWAYSEFQDKHNKHPDTGTVFKGYYIPQVPMILECAKKMQSRLTQMKIISWDMTLDEEGTVVLVEINTIGQTCWFPQMANGEPFFRDNTAAILQSMRKKKIEYE